MKIAIEKNVPVVNLAGRPMKYPFSELKIGYSFSVKSNNYSPLTSANAWALREKNGWKFKGSLSKGLLKVWRIK